MPLTSQKCSVPGYDSGSMLGAHLVHTVASQVLHESAAVVMRALPSQSVTRLVHNTADNPMINKALQESGTSLLSCDVQGDVRKIFIEFLERSCTAEFSGFLLYRELGRRLKKTSPAVAEIFSLMVSACLDIENICQNLATAVSTGIIMRII